MPSVDHKLLVVSLRTGRLANRLVLFANVIGFAAEHGHRVANVAFHSFAHLFENTSRDIYCRYPVPRHRSVLDVIPGAAPAIRKARIFYHVIRRISELNGHCPILGRSAITIREVPRQIILLDSPEAQTRIADPRVVFVHGWWIRAPESVRRRAKMIREYFEPIPEVEHPAREAVARLRQQADIVAGVHIRQGDYRRWRNGQYFFPVSRYAAWMREFTEQFPGKKTAFLVCSDEPREPGEFAGLTVGFGPGFPAGDLFALARCDYVFGPYSTFSQWASFHGEKPLFQFCHTGDRIDLGKFHISGLDESP